ncbi:MAG: DUF3795 domain-containing protein [Planctomycetes bacterium]|nr:DUF3795 domain-containing protein [Planctomycetota bacterium]
MKRRDFLEVAGAGLVAAQALGQTPNAQAAAPTGAAAEKLLAPPCGIYCAVCPGYRNGNCHGCPCPCGQCEGARYAAACDIVNCTRERKIESCADCPDLPCTKLIMRANDPVWRTGAVSLENLRRRKRIGTAAWLAEQKQFWSDQKKRDRWLVFYRDCAERDKTFGK